MVMLTVVEALHLSLPRVLRLHPPSAPALQKPLSATTKKKKMMMMMRKREEEEKEGEARKEEGRVFITIRIIGRWVTGVRNSLRPSWGNRHRVLLLPLILLRSLLPLPQLLLLLLFLLCHFINAEVLSNPRRATSTTAIIATATATAMAVVGLAVGLVAVIDEEGTKDS